MQTAIKRARVKYPRYTLSITLGSIAIARYSTIVLVREGGRKGEGDGQIFQLELVRRSEAK